MSVTSVAEFQQALAAAHPPTAQLHLRFAHCRVVVHTNAPTLLEKLRGYFAPFVAPPALESETIEIFAHEAPPLDPAVLPALSPFAPEPGKARVKEEYAELRDGRLVRKRLTGMVFAFGGTRHVAVGPCVANDNQIVNFVNSRFIQAQVRRGYLLCHAAGLALARPVAGAAMPASGAPSHVSGETRAASAPARGLALAGMSGRGKSTLALHLLNRGFDFVSNDRLLIRRGAPLADGRPQPAAADAALEMVGVAKWPRVNPGTLLNNPALQGILSPDERARYSALPKDELRRLEAKYDVLIEACYGPNRFRLAATMRAAVILNWNWEAGPLRVTRFEPAARPDLLAALMKRLGLFFEPPGGGLGPDPQPHEYIAMLADLPCYEFTGGVDFDAAADACARLLTESA